MNQSDHQDNLPSPTQHQWAIPNSHDSEFNNDENEKTKTESRRRYGIGRNVSLESFPCAANDNDEATHLIQNGDLSIDHTFKSAPAFPFSVVKVWIYATLTIAIYIVGMMTLGPLTSQYLVLYFSQEHNNSTTNSSRSRGTCSNSTDSEDAFMNMAQKKASSTMLYSSLASNIPAFFICLFAGSISDFVGRKPLLIVSLLGILIKTVLLSLIIKYQLNVALVYVGSAVDGIVGSYYVVVLAVTAIITDITVDSNNKAGRYLLLEGIILVFGSLSQLAVGYLIQAAGFFIPVVICNCLLLIPLLVTIFLLPETLPCKQKISWDVRMHLKKTFGFYFSSINGKSLRLQFIMGLTAHFTVMFANIGKSYIETLFVLNKPICWSSAAIGVFGAVRMVITAVAAVITLKLCKNRLSLEMTAVICGISSTAGFILEGFADSTLMMYLASAVGILFTATFPLPRALLSQIAPPGVQGALFSSMSCTEAIASLASSTLYLLIYNATVDTFKGAAFMAVAAMCLLNTISLGVFRLLRPSQKDYEYLVEDPVNATTRSPTTDLGSEDYGNFADDTKKGVQSSPILT
ncbi:unnamed protein product [Candidula unifasciata]|uniref:Major facilitator superfamily (MFS) profile domain-containing protein n=1 Tax=Candidula unifasciata TaxID=100452 RepID=A0A8S3Z413_9EUPU|nr:unnamed protein product [Candidula unifasciata]